MGGSKVDGVRLWRWRPALPVIVFVCGLVAFLSGVGVTARVGLASSGLLTKAYYTLGLFVLGGLDLGVPDGGPTWGRGLLWFAYFAAPAITASAVVESVLRTMGPSTWRLRRMRGHVVIAGCGKLTMLYLQRLRQVRPRCPVVIIEQQADRTNLEEARDVFGALVVTGDVRSGALLSMVALERASQVMLLTDDDFANLDAASKILAIAPNLGQRTVVHIGDLQFLRAMGTTRVAAECRMFNTHQIAAEHLVTSKLRLYFDRTERLDFVVLAGFGRFGQTVLDCLQRDCSGKFDTVVAIDLDGNKRARQFDEFVGFGDYRRDVVSGDLSDPLLWDDLEERFELSGRDPVFVLGSGQDGTNMKTALWLSGKYPAAYIVARGFRHSSFVQDVSREGGFEAFSVADLVLQSIPATWLTRRGRRR